VRSEGFYVSEKYSDTNWDRTSDLPMCSTAPNRCAAALSLLDLLIIFYSISALYVQLNEVAPCNGSSTEVSVN